MVKASEIQPFGSFSRNSAYLKYKIFILASKSANVLFLNARGSIRQIAFSNSTRRRWNLIYLHTTRCPHGAVCIVALAFTQMTHWNKYEFMIRMQHLIHNWCGWQIYGFASDNLHVIRFIIYKWANSDKIKIDFFCCVKKMRPIFLRLLIILLYLVRNVYLVWLLWTYASFIHTSTINIDQSTTSHTNSSTFFFSFFLQLLLIILAFLSRVFFAFIWIVF